MLHDFSPLRLSAFVNTCKAVKLNENSVWLKNGVMLQEELQTLII